MVCFIKLYQLKFRLTVHSMELTLSTYAHIIFVLFSDSDYDFASQRLCFYAEGLQGDRDIFCSIFLILYVVFNYLN